jgi:hypothetical protein
MRDLDELLDWHIANYGIVRMADVDELIMRIESAKSSLPSRFKTVSAKLKDFDESIPDFHRNRCTRLKRMLEVSSKLPKPLAKLQDNDLHPTFKLDENDRVLVLNLCSDMRKIVLNTTHFDNPHKVRLSNRIAAIEAEVHKDNGLFDVVLGGVSDFGETLGQFGRDIKPLTNRMSEVLKITRKSTKSYDQLPSPEEIKQLPPPDDTDEE